MSGEATSGGGAVKPEAGSTSGNGAGVNMDELASKVAELLSPKMAEMVTGASKRIVESTVASKLEGIDLEALKAGKPDKKTDKAKEVDPDIALEVNRLRSEFEKSQAEANKWRSVGLRGKLLEEVGKRGVHEHSLDLVVDKFAMGVDMTPNGALVFKEGDDVKPLGDVLDSFLKGRDGLLKATAREGTGSGAKRVFGEPMPKNKRELLFSQVQGDIDPVSRMQRATPERVIAFKAAHGSEAFNALPD